ncbi:uncharacterized protein LOC127462982 [Manacus candei]|uniref:uncharacterized protein LOC127462982 n=1 Tax=Manacus candei TaxID=415023 RepID=UPI00222693EC|nr:uncharacterized protein LOC127462982 [Manacus candei]
MRWLSPPPYTPRNTGVTPLANVLNPFSINNSGNGNFGNLPRVLREKIWDGLVFWDHFSPLKIPGNPGVTPLPNVLNPFSLNNSGKGNCGNPPLPPRVLRERIWDALDFWDHFSPLKIPGNIGVTPFPNVLGPFFHNNSGNGNCGNPPLPPRVLRERIWDALDFWDHFSLLKIPGNIGVTPLPNVLGPFFHNNSGKGNFWNPPLFSQSPEREDLGCPCFLGSLFPLKIPWNTGVTPLPNVLDPFSLNNSGNGNCGNSPLPPRVLRERIWDALDFWDHFSPLKIPGNIGVTPFPNVLGPFFHNNSGNGNCGNPPLPPRVLRERIWDVLDFWDHFSLV